MTSVEAAINELISFPIFNQVPKSLVLELCEGGKIITSSHREQLYRCGDFASTFGIVLSGAYKLSKPTPMGDDVIVHFSTPGDVIAAFIMAQPNPIYPVTATAMGPSRFLRLSRDIFLSQWKKNPDLILRIQSLLSTRMNLLQDHKVMARSPLPQRVASLLLSLIDKNSDTKDLTLPLRLTRREIAENLGSSVEAVIRIMSDWSKQGIIQTNDQVIEVLRPDKIVDLMNS